SGRGGGIGGGATMTSY
ncbi:unnamed protein product, partial [Rotaria magnacalcarata]